MMGESAPIQRWVQLAGYALIVGAALMVLSPFLVPLAWAAILAFATWRPYERVRRGLGGRAPLAAPPMTTLERGPRRGGERAGEHTAGLPSPAYLLCPLFFFNDTATTEIYTLSLHDALPIFIVGAALMVLSPFLVPLAWAAILAFATWRPYERVRRGLGGRAWLAAALMTTLERAPRREGE